MKQILTTAIWVIFAACWMPISAQAALMTYDTWTSNEGISGNYILTIDDSMDDIFKVSLTVNPWNAEALGLFVDFGDVDVGAVGLSNIVTSPTAGGSVTVSATDTTSDSCDSGCNLNGLNPPIAGPDDEWELVFRLGSQGFDDIQTFSFEINDFGLALSDWGLVGVRSQVLCSGDELLPGDKDNCGDSDKSFSSDPGSIPEPGILGLMGVGLLGFSLARRREQRLS